MFHRGDLVPLLPQVGVPTLFLTGAEDSLFPVDEARAQASRIPRCRFAVVERSSHLSALEAPERVVPAVRQALAEWLPA
jgi:pimeloyl-ACP methyl ester carboxylesterase